MSECRAAVVIPAYRVASIIGEVIAGVPAWVEAIIVVDDGCPEGSGEAAEQAGDDRVSVVYHERNQGVGGAMVTGYREALLLGCDIVVKMDGDGQMDPRYLPRLVAPLQQGRADYAKGNRFRDFVALAKMPKARLFGNNVLSFLEKLFSGYWNIMDPTNGYTAIHRRVLEKINLDKVAKDYFFESDMLLRLNLIDAVVEDVPMPARYGDEASSLSVLGSAVRFTPKLFGGLLKRIFFKCFIYDFNMASVYLVVGVPLFLWGVFFGAYEWIDSVVTDTPKTAGTIMLAALPLILSLEMLLQAVNIDIQNARENRERRRQRENSGEGCGGPA